MKPICREKNEMMSDDAIVSLHRHRLTGGVRLTQRSPPPPPCSYACFHQISSPPSPSPISRRPRRPSMIPNPRLFSLLQALILAVVISLFFLFLGIAAIFLVHICVAGGVLHRRRRNFEYRNFGLGGVEILDARLSREELQRLPCFSYEAVIEPAMTRDCVVCLESFRKGDRCRILPRCKHLFHADCVDAWLIKVPACPICRSVVELEVGMKSRLGSEGVLRI